MEILTDPYSNGWKTASSTIISLSFHLPSGDLSVPASAGESGTR